MANKSSQAYQIKIQLDEIRPPIWRRILVPGNTTLLKLHDILQIVMGWENYHLHEFKVNSQVYGDPENDEFGEKRLVDETRFTLSMVLLHEKQRFSYLYDFGDSWHHNLTVEKIVPKEKDIQYPLCLNGKRACPPEDVGGVWGYEEYLRILQNPDDEEYEQFIEWRGDSFEPEAFDIQHVNTELKKMGIGISTEQRCAWYRYEDPSNPTSLIPSPNWLLTLPADLKLAAEQSPTRHDSVLLLTYIRDHKLTGTTSTGNLPLKAVREIYAQFAETPTLDPYFETVLNTARSEEDVWPLYFRHVLVWAAGCLSGGMGKRWVLTPTGEEFLKKQPEEQLWNILITWWYKINWLFTLGGYAPHFQLTTSYQSNILEMLRSQTSPNWKTIEQSVKEIRGNVKFPSTLSHEQQIATLERLIITTILKPLQDLSLLTTKLGAHKILGEKHRVITAFQLPPLGKSMLNGLAQYQLNR